MLFQFTKSYLDCPATNKKRLSLKLYGLLFFLSENPSWNYCRRRIPRQQLRNFLKNAAVGFTILLLKLTILIRKLSVLMSKVFLYCTSPRRMARTIKELPFFILKAVWGFSLSFVKRKARRTFCDLGKKRCLIRLLSLQLCVEGCHR